MITKSTLVASIVVVSSFTGSVAAQQTNAQVAPSQPVARQSQVQSAQQPDQSATSTARRWGVGVHGGVGIDPEIIDVGAHVSVGPVFNPNLSFRPGLEVGAGEVTTFLGINLDLLYSFRGDGANQWYPYVGAGPTFGLSHRGFETEELDHVNIDDNDDRNRFDFSDTDFNGGMNFVVGMRKASGVFFEMKATAWGVSNIRLVAGFNF